MFAKCRLNQYSGTLSSLLSVVTKMLLIKRVSALIFFCILLAAAVCAQSGRRAPQTPTAQPAPEPVPADAPKIRAPVKPLFFLRVISDIPMELYRAFPKPEWMRSWTVERLRDSLLLDTTDGGLGNRTEAIRTAKNETDVYVVLLQLQMDSFSRLPPNVSVKSGEVWIDVTVYFPKTGKVKYSRRVRLNEDRRVTGPIGIGTTCHRGVYGNDFILLQASLETAEAVMYSFNLPIPRDCSRIDNPFV